MPSHDWLTDLPIHPFKNTFWGLTGHFCSKRKLVPTLEAYSPVQAACLKVTLRNTYLPPEGRAEEQRWAWARDPHWSRAGQACPGGRGRGLEGEQPLEEHAYVWMWVWEEVQKELVGHRERAEGQSIWDSVCERWLAEPLQVRGYADYRGRGPRGVQSAESRALWGAHCRPCALQAPAITTNVGWCSWTPRKPHQGCQKPSRRALWQCNCGDAEILWSQDEYHKA